MEPISKDVIVRKDGVNWLEMDISRSWKDGRVRFQFKAHPRIEEYFQTISKGKVGFLNEFGGGQEWKTEGPDALQSYYVGNDSFEGMKNFFFGFPGYMMKGMPDYHGKVNLSFLHLKGVSVGDGVRFWMTIPISKGEILEMQKQIEDGVKEFTGEFLTNVKIGFRISSYEV